MKRDLFYRGYLYIQSMVISMNVKTYSIIFFTAIFLISCTSSQKMLERGQYDRAIDRAAEKLQKKPGNTKELNVLKEAYELANMFDRERIEFLELEGLDESYIEIFQLYELLNYRQNKIRRLPTQVRNQFTFYNYDQEIIESKSAAADISYRRGIEFMERGDKAGYRNAWVEFERTARLFPGYKDVDQQLVQSHAFGQNHALFVVENNSGMIVPEYFSAELAKISLRDLNTRWLNFDTFENEHTRYDYLLMLNIKNISYSPETVERRIINESKEIQDGMRYKYDNNGNVKKDSLGNDIRVPDLKNVSVEITESLQQKTAFVGGSLDIFELETDQLVRTQNLSVEFVFENRYGSFSGDKRALSEQGAAIVGGREMPFPSNEQMVIDAAELLKDRSRAVIRNQRRMLER